MVKRESHYDILEYCNRNNVSIKDNKKKNDKQWELSLEDIIDIYGNGFGCSAIIVVNAITELIFDIFLGNVDIKGIFNSLGEKLRYGLFSKKNLGLRIRFLDRILFQRIAETISSFKVDKLSIKSSIKENKSVVTNILADYPVYFNYMLSILTVHC